MKNGKFKLYAEFTKVEEQEDGTLKVAGIASSEAKDSDGEIITGEAMKAALPDYMKFGAVREMHTSWAAGTALNASVNGDNQTEFEALVVDAEAVKKVQTGVYKGFSIGGKVTQRDGNVIKGIRLIEVSLVDRPANPEALFSFGKVEGTDDGATLGEIRKGMWEVMDFADILQRLAWLQQNVACEAEWEGDASPVPADLRDALSLLAEAFKNMAAEEVAELLAALPTSGPQSVEVVELAEGTEDLTKRGQKYSKATKASLSEIHKAMRECDSKLAAMGYEDAEEEEGEEEEPKKAEASEAIAKAAGLESDLAKVEAERDALTKRVKELEAIPLPPKGKVMAIAKGEENAPDPLEPLKKEAESLPPGEAKALALIKLAHRAGPVR